MTIDTIKEIMGEHLDMNTDDIKASTSFEELGIDSLETVEIMMELEDEFDIEIEVSEIGKTVGSLVEYIEGKKE